MSRVVLEMPSEYAFTTRLRVRVTDLNFGGHVGNDRLLGYLQEARSRFLGTRGYTETDIDGVGLVLADAALRFRAEVVRDDELEVAIAVRDLREHSCDFYYRVVRDDSERTPVLDAKTGIVFLDYATRSVVAMPDAFRDWIARG